MTRNTRSDAFWQYVHARPGCWPWLGRVINSGYGRYDKTTAHRAMYEDAVGPIPPGMEVDHLCFNRLCVRPSHLEVVTRAENMRRWSDRFWQERQGRCGAGHVMAGDNVYVNKLGRLVCRSCRRNRDAAFKAKCERIKTEADVA